jgi:hypothetical protein
MHLHTSGILDLLLARTGRFVESHKGHYVMKEADGTNVFVIEDGKRVHIQPLESQIDELITGGHLVKEDSRYHLP